MDDKQAIEALYRRYWQYMIDADADGLRSLMREDYTLRHMTGLQQSREDFLRGLLDGTFRYFGAEHDTIEVTVHGQSAAMRAKSRVLAAVYGGRKNLWRLRGDFTLRKENGTWRLTGARASTY